jgi:KUP system potassium uptake protein
MDFLSLIPMRGIPRRPGTGVFVAAEGEVRASTLARFVSNCHQLPEQLVFVKMSVEEVPSVPLGERTRIRRLREGTLLAMVRFGFNDEPDLPQTLRACPGLLTEASSTWYFVEPEFFGLVAQSKMMVWRKWLFSLMARASISATEYLHLPIDRTTLLPR